MPRLSLSTRPTLATFSNTEKGDILELRKARFQVTEKTPNEIRIQSFGMAINAGSRMSAITFTNYRYKHTGMKQTSL